MNKIKLKQRLLVIALAVLVSCSHQYSEKRIVFGSIDRQDYLDQLNQAMTNFLKREAPNVLKLDYRQKNYLEVQYKNLIEKNEALLGEFRQVHFYIVKSSKVFYMSAPGDVVVLSTSLVKKYLKSEELLMSLLAYEAVKNRKAIYEKNLIFPLEEVALEKMLLHVRIPTEAKMRLNEWSFYILKRAGYDPTSFLNWIQVQNRNMSDFIDVLGDSTTITREEQAFKKFLALEGTAVLEGEVPEKNSSSDYYHFIKNIN